jgi:hypothetical protein
MAFIGLGLQAIWESLAENYDMVSRSFVLRLIALRPARVSLLGFVAAQYISSGFSLQALLGPHNFRGRNNVGWRDSHPYRIERVGWTGTMADYTTCGIENGTFTRRERYVNDRMGEMYTSEEQGKSGFQQLSEAV